MIDIGVVPSARLPIALARQRQIIDNINAKLTANLLQGFCFSGSPGTGKTYLMQAIRRTVGRELTKLDESLREANEVHGANKTRRVRPSFPDVVCLAEWAQSNLDRSRGQEVQYTFDLLTAKHIGIMAERNRHNNPIVPFETLHVFIDEFDCQPTVSAFSSTNLQTFVNAIYRNAPRFVAGNEAEFVQLVLAMNKSWPEFEAAYGTHIARRIAEMCVRIDFDRSVIVDPIPTPPQLPVVADSIDAALDDLLLTTGQPTFSDGVNPSVTL